MRLSILILLSTCLMAPVIFAQNPDYLPNDSDHWYQSLDNPTDRIHRYGGDPVNGFQSHHIESWVNGIQQWHTVWAQTRDEAGNIFNHQVSGNGGATWSVLIPPLPLVQSPLEVGSTWDYISHSLPLTYSAHVTSEQYLCADNPTAFRVLNSQNYAGTVTIFVDHYIDGYGVAMMEWYGWIYMAEDCFDPVSVEQVSWASLKATYR